MSKELSLVPTQEEFNIIQMMAKTAAESKHFEKIGGFAGLFSIALYAREIGISPMTALHGGLIPVMGKITMSAEMMNSLIRQKGHKLEILEATDKVCRIKGTRKDTGETYTASFTIEMAIQAGLKKAGGGYDKHPSDMLFARCISLLKRRLFPDVACKAYVEGEIEEAEIEEVTPSPIVENSLSTLTPVQCENIERLIAEDPKYRKNLLAIYNVQSFDEIPINLYEFIFERVKIYAEKKESQKREKEEKSSPEFDLKSPSVFADTKSSD